MKTTFQKRMDAAKKAIEKADYIAVGGGAGLSAAAGIIYSGERFTKNFAPFIEKYGLTDMYSSGFYPFPTEEERWAYWAKHIWINRFEPEATLLYQSLYKLVKEKNYFVITTNVDSQFVKSGVPEKKVFDVQGNYGALQCAKGCHDTVYPNKELVKKWLAQTNDCKIPTALVPQCPVCGGSMEPHLRKDQYFVQDARWHESHEAYNRFLQESDGKRIVFMELGVGYNTPGIIRYPFEQMTHNRERSVLIRLNKEHPEGMMENREKTIAFTEDMQAVMDQFLN